MDGDGIDEVFAGDILNARGQTTSGAEFSKQSHIDAVMFGDIRPDLPGLEVVVLEEQKYKFRFPQHVTMLKPERVVWATSHKLLEPQNAAIGEFDVSSPGLEIWLRSGQEKNQTPWVLSAKGEVLSEYAMASQAPKGWTVRGVDLINAIHWTGRAKQLAVAKARHQAGDVALFDAISGTFHTILKTQAHRLLIADVRGDWREEIIVRTSNGLEIYENSSRNPNPGKPRLWNNAHYSRSKVTWNYYNP